jgi:hypothetical protein
MRRLYAQVLFPGVLFPGVVVQTLHETGIEGERGTPTALLGSRLDEYLVLGELDLGGRLPITVFFMVLRLESVMGVNVIAAERKSWPALTDH